MFPRTPPLIVKGNVFYFPYRAGPNPLNVCSNRGLLHSALAFSYFANNKSLLVKNIVKSQYIYECIYSVLCQPHNWKTSLPQAVGWQPAASRQNHRQIWSLCRAGDQMSTVYSVIRPPLLSHDMGHRFLCLLRRQWASDQTEQEAYVSSSIR